ncbi:MAG: 16S rRNA (guanine(527)-N(7))-methyltransferase RsmG [Eggerthellaceae bacterium]|nr:16S rRNA (guanine(527)-N(7))-methyltransferase RsmG [Eggerthellaceae bacterium]
MDARKEELINRYLDEILEVNKHINLTRIDESHEAKMLHLEDSLSGLPELDAAPEGRYADLGSGGGFPGVPLGIASGRETLLVDSVKKKMAAVHSVLVDMGLDSMIRTYDGRIEELAISHARQFSVVSARALSKLSVLLELAAPLLKKSGRLLCYKAQLTDEELEHALSLQNYLGMKLVSDRKFYLNDGETLRRILAFEKVKEPGLKLPRRIGLAQKKPL